MEEQDVGRWKIKIPHPDSILADASSLISLADVGLIGVLIALRPYIKGELLITEEVERESIERPLKIPKYSFSGVRLKRALFDGVFKIITPNPETTDKVMKLANTLFSIGGKPFKLIHKGEAEIVAVAIDNKLKTLLIDERTTRTLIESPFETKKHLTEEFRRGVDINREALNEFKELTNGINMIRSSEIIALGYEYGYFKKFGDLKKDAFKAALYAIKFNGCAIGFDEINELIREIEGS